MFNNVYRDLKMLYVSLVWLTYTNIVQSVYIFNNENINLGFLQIANPGVIFTFLKYFQCYCSKNHQIFTGSAKHLCRRNVCKKNSKIYFFDFLMQKTQFLRFYPLKKMFFENFNTHCILTLINNNLVLGSLFFFEVIRRYLKISAKY